MGLTQAWLGDAHEEDSYDSWIPEHYLEDHWGSQVLCCAWVDAEQSVSVNALIFFGEGLVTVYVKHIFSTTTPVARHISMEIVGPEGKGVEKFELLPDYVTGYIMAS